MKFFVVCRQEFSIPFRFVIGNLLPESLKTLFSDTRVKGFLYLLIHILAKGVTTVFLFKIFSKTRSRYFSSFDEPFSPFLAMYVYTYLLDDGPYFGGFHGDQSDRQVCCLLAPYRVRLSLLTFTQTASSIQRRRKRCLWTNHPPSSVFPSLPIRGRIFSRMGFVLLAGAVARAFGTPSVKCYADSAPTYG